MPAPSEPSEVFATLIVAFAFLFISAAGSSRVLKVLDRRNYLMPRLAAAALMSAGIGGGGGVTVTAGGINYSGGAGGTPSSTLRHTGSISPRHSTLGTAAGGGGGMYGATLTDSVLSDNRFLIGINAVVLGVGRCAYLLMILMMTSTGVSGDTVRADTATAPFAFFFFCLLASVLVALQELIERVRSTILGSVTSSPSLSPQRLNHNHEEATTEGGNTAIGDAPSCMERIASKLKPFRAVTTFVVLLVVITISLIAAWATRGDEDKTVGNKSTQSAARLIPTVTSSIISFVLMLWSIWSTIESVKLLRQVGVAAHRVTIAMVVMTIFLSLRGALILPPVQSSMCDDEAFWRCGFLYDFVDCAGVLLILQILP